MGFRWPKPDPVKPGQESVWDYPRPAVAEGTTKHLQVYLGGVLIADTHHGVRTLETSHPPTYYFPPEDVVDGVLIPVPGSSLCEWKGAAKYFDVVGADKRVHQGAWSYPSPTKPFEMLAGFIAFMPSEMDACLVDGEKARPQKGGFYGGWITDDLAGPFKGPAGTRTW